MKEIFGAIFAFLAFIAIVVFSCEYEHNAKMECVKHAMEKQYTASDIRAICWK